MSCQECKVYDKKGDKDVDQPVFAEGHSCQRLNNPWVGEEYKEEQDTKCYKKKEDNRDFFLLCFFLTKEAHLKDIKGVEQHAEAYKERTGVLADK